MSYYDIQGNLVNEKKSIENFSDLENNMDYNYDDNKGDVDYGDYKYDDTVTDDAGYDAPISDDDSELLNDEEYLEDLKFAKTACNKNCKAPVWYEKDNTFKMCINKQYKSYADFSEKYDSNTPTLKCNIKKPKNINKINFKTLDIEKSLNNKIAEERELQLKNRTDKLKPKKDTFANTNDPFYANRLKEFFVLLENEKDKVLDATINYDKKNTKDRLNYYPYILDACHSYLKALEDYGTSQIVDIQNITRSVYFELEQKDKGTFISNLVGDKKKFKEDLEKALGFKLDIPEGFDGVSYDSKGRLREHGDRSSGGCCYLITALTHDNLLSIRKVYQLKQIMNQAFENPENRKLMAFYYQNFGPVADHLKENDQLKQLLPFMEQVNSFDDYIQVCYQAVDLANSTGFDGESLKQTFESFNGSIEHLPHPNVMFNKITVSN